MSVERKYGAEKQCFGVESERGTAFVGVKALRSVSGDARHRTGLRRVDDDLACHGCAGMSALIWIVRETAGC